MIEFRPARWGDVNAIARRMRTIDAEECRIAGYTPKGALVAGYRQSDMLWTGTVDQRPEAMFGVVCTSLLTGEGRPWMLGTETARANARAFLTLAPAFLAQIEELCPRLENYVHRDNAASIRWLRRLGFVVEPELLHIGTAPVLRFWRAPPPCAGPHSSLPSEAPSEP